MKILVALLFFGLVSPASAEGVQVKYRDSSVPLESFSCQAISDSSFVFRACYDARTRYLLLNLNDTYYHYCEIGEQVVEEFLEADSKGRFYNNNIKSNANGGRYDCRNHVLPEY